MLMFLTCFFFGKHNIFFRRSIWKLKDLQLIIMAGGKGTRISRLAKTIPKPMIPIGGKPVLEHQLNFFRELGFNKATISIGHLGQVIKNYFNDGSRFGIGINYIEENEPLVTAGALRFSAEQPNLLLVVNGDILFDFDLETMLPAQILRFSLTPTAILSTARLSKRRKMGASFAGLIRKSLAKTLPIE